MNDITLINPGAVRVLSEPHFQAAATRLSVPIAAVRAFAEVESAGTGFIADGRPTILYEPHIFHRETGGKFAHARDTKGVPLSVPRRDSSLYGPAGAHQYDRLTAAMRLDVDAALRSCSWGAFQVMGFNHAMVGYATVRDMVADMVSGAPGQLSAFLGYIEKNNLQPDMRLLPDPRAAARLAHAYNGPTYAENRYDEKIVSAFNRWTSNPNQGTPLRIGSRGEGVRVLQSALGLTADGIFGSGTDAAVRRAQASNGLTADGIAGSQTHKALGLPWPPAT